MVQALRLAVYRGESLEMVGARLKEVTKRLEVLNQLRNLENLLIAQRNDPRFDPQLADDVEEVLESIRLARRMYEFGQDQEVQELLNSQSVKTLLEKLENRPDTPQENLVPAIMAAQDATNRAAQPEPTAGGRTSRSEERKQQWESMKKEKQWRIKVLLLLGMLRAEVTRHLVRPFLKVAFLLGLLYVGLESLYVTPGVTFGTNPFTDYLSLVLWGLGSDVASRSIANLRGGTAQA